MKNIVSASDYYHRYINNSQKDIQEYISKLDKTNDNIKELRNYLEDNYNIYLEQFNIDLNGYIEYTDYLSDNSNSKKLLNKIYSIIDLVEDSVNKNYLYQVVKYCNQLTQRQTLLERIEVAKHRNNIKYARYKELISLFYKNLHYHLLKGETYKFKHKIGILEIVKLKLIDTENKKRTVNFAKTYKKKQEILNAGLKLYDKIEAEWYKERNIPYDGVEYIVYCDNSVTYKICISHSTVLPSKYKHKFTPVRVNTNKEVIYRQKQYNNLEDIANLDLGLQSKISIYLTNFPDQHHKYSRIESDDYNDYRTNNW